MLRLEAQAPPPPPPDLPPEEVREEPKAPAGFLHRIFGGKDSETGAKRWENGLKIVKKVGFLCKEPAKDVPSAPPAEVHLYVKLWCERVRRWRRW